MSSIFLSSVKITISNNYCLVKSLKSDIITSDNTIFFNAGDIILFLFTVKMSCNNKNIISYFIASVIASCSGSIGVRNFVTLLLTLSFCVIITPNTELNKLRINTGLKLLVNSLILSRVYSLVSLSDIKATPFIWYLYNTINERSCQGLNKQTC